MRGTVLAWLQPGIDMWKGKMPASFRRAPAVVAATAIAVLYAISAALAPWIAPHDVFDAKTLDLVDSSLPPAWQQGGRPEFLLGTDQQGRDILSAILFGSRMSIAMGAASIAL